MSIDGDNNSPNPKYLQIARELRAGIGMELRAGDYLPSERDLCRRFGVNLKTVRSALAVLQRDGLVEKRPSRGTVVLESQGSQDSAETPARESAGNAVALVMPLESYLVAAIARGVERELRRRGFRLQLCGTYTLAQMRADSAAAREYERSVLEALERDNVAGAIWWSVFGRENADAAERLLRQGIPLVLIDNPPAGLACDWVGIDDYGAAAQATQHLIDLGYRGIAFYAGAAGDALPPLDGERMLGYLDTLRAVRHETVPLPLELAGLSRDVLAQALPESARNLIFFADDGGADALLAHRPRPAAVVCASSLLAEALQQDLERRGVRAPEDIALVSIGDTAYYEGRPTTLTCIHQPFEQMAQRSARLLLQRLRSPRMPVQRLCLPAYLVIRQSSRPANQARGRRAIPGARLPGFSESPSMEPVMTETAASDALKRTIDDVIAQGPFRADWESLKSCEIPRWYEDGKFGIFMHWGVYSVPAFGSEWYSRNMYQKGSPEFDHHVKTYGPQDQFGYKDFIPQMTYENYDPDAYAALFREAGAKFVVPVAEHHDGFAMYDTGLSRWNAARMGPGRDVLGELAAAVEREGLVLGASSHRAEHFWFFDGGRKFPSDVQDPEYADFYGPAEPAPSDWSDPTLDPPTEEFLQDWLERTCEIVEKYRPQLVWFDWWIQTHAFKPYLQKFAAFYYNRGAQWGKGVAINYKYDAFPEGAAVFDVERGQLSGIRARLWQNDTSVSKNSWGYVHNQDYKSVDSLVDDLVDVVSKNGALLLNIGPKPDGAIPEPEQRMLREIGAWLAVNGEAIYGTRPWKIFGEGPTEVQEGAFTDTNRSDFTGEDIRFTTKDGALYAIALAWPGRTLTIKSLAAGSPHADGAIASVTLLGHDGALKWTQDRTGLAVTMPEDRPCSHAFAVKIEMR